jgi:hypothetical protein
MMLSSHRSYTRVLTEDPLSLVRLAIHSKLNSFQGFLVSVT